MLYKVNQSKKDLIHNLKTEFNNSRVIKAFEKIPRELFINKEYRHLAYEDIALPIITLSVPATKAVPAAIPIATLHFPVTVPVLIASIPNAIFIQPVVKFCAAP